MPLTGKLTASTRRVRAAATRNSDAAHRLRALATGRRAWFALCAAAVLTIAALAGLGSSLYNAQSNARDAVADRFAERARVSAALTESLFTSSASASQPRFAARYGAARVPASTLAAEAKRGQMTSLVLLGADGEILARSPRTPAAVIRMIRLQPPFLRKALTRQTFTLSDVMSLGGSPDTIQFAQPIATRSGRRVLLSGVPPKLLYGFIGGYLAEVPEIEGGQCLRARRQRRGRRRAEGRRRGRACSSVSRASSPRPVAPVAGASATGGTSRRAR